jgi:hypothetical protein
MKTETNVAYLLKDSPNDPAQINWATPQLWDGDRFEPAAPLYYGAQIVIRKDGQLAQEIMDVHDRILAAVFEDDWKTVKRKLIAQDRLAIRDGDFKGGALEGHYYINGKNKNRILVLDRDRNPVSAEDNVIYNGCHVNAKIEFWGQNHAKYGQRVNAKLLGVQFSRDGEPFVVGTGASVNDFEVITDEAEPALA